MDSPVAGLEGDTHKHHKEGQEKNSSELQSTLTTSTKMPEEKVSDTRIDNLGIDSLTEKRISSSLAGKIKEDFPEIKDEDEDENSSRIKNLNSPPREKAEVESDVQSEVVESVVEKRKAESPDVKGDIHEDENLSEIENSNSPLPEKLVAESNIQREKQVESETKSSDTSDKESEIEGQKRPEDSKKESNDLKVQHENSGANKNLEHVTYEEDVEPVFDGTEVPGIEANRSLSTGSLENDSESQRYAWPEKAVAIKNFVREKSVVAVSSVLRRLSGKSDDGEDIINEKDKNDGSVASSKKVASYSQEAEAQEVYQKSGERSGWNPLSLIGISHDTDLKSNTGHTEDINKSREPIPVKGRIILYTRLGSQECKEARLFLHFKRLRYVEINIDVYPSRKLELEKIAGSSAVPRVFFNEVLVGGLSELKDLDESGQLAEKIEYIISEAPPFEAPLPPLSGEDDVSSSGTVDELGVIVRKMKNFIVVKDRFYKMRRFTNCFLGSEAVDFLSEDQYLEREEAVEFGRKLASKLFFQHVLDENLFEEGNHVYRFLDDDPLVSQCQNIPRGITEVKPKPIADISSRLRFLCCAIYEAYTSEDGKHVDYRSIHGSEEFARYLRIVEELQRVELHDMPREEKLAFFINLYNMMAIHAILVLGHPSGVLERRKLFGEFKYVIGGCTYSLSAIHNGILRANQRPPYNLTKPFGLKDKRLKVALPYTEPLVHFTLVCGTRSSPALRCYSPGNIDKELIDAAHNFLTSGGLIVDLDSKIASISKILKWYSTDFGKNEVEVLKHAANYLDPEDCQTLLELLDTTQFKVIDQPYDWGLNL